MEGFGLGGIEQVVASLFDELGVIFLSLIDLQFPFWSLSTLFHLLFSNIRHTFSQGDQGDRCIPWDLQAVMIPLNSPVRSILLAKPLLYLVTILKHLPLPTSWFLFLPRTTHSVSWRLDDFKGSNYRRT